MNSKERIMKLFRGEEIDVVPCAPHWWGLYKFALAGMIGKYEGQNEAWSMTGKKLAGIDANFYDTFKPDWFQLSNGYDLAVREDHKTKKAREMKSQVQKLESIRDIDEYLDLKYDTYDEIVINGIYEHVDILVKKYGGEAFIALNESSPICTILDPDGTMGFEAGLIALVEKPRMMEYLIFQEYEKKLEQVRVLKKYGCHGYIGSETYCTPDLIAPSTYRNLIFPAQKHFYRQVKKIGLVPIAYFLGDILPIIGDINHLGITALMVEESKKNYRLDIGEIRKNLAPDITLFGNLDSVHTLLEGTAQDVALEAKTQMEARKRGRFILANGCPIAFDTLVENIRAMIATAHETVY